MNICRKNLAPKNLDVAKPQIEIAIKPAEVRVDTVSVIMASKSVKIHSAAKKCCGLEEPAICAVLPPPGIRFVLCCPPPQCSSVLLPHLGEYWRMGTVSDI